MNNLGFVIFIVIGIISISPIMFFMVQAEENTIPSWIKNTAKFWVDEQVTDIEFINALEYMINNNIINVSSQNTKYEDAGDFYVKYNPNPNSNYEYSAKNWIMDLEYFETNILFLNSLFNLPHDVEISLQECKNPMHFMIQKQNKSLFAMNL